MESIPVACDPQVFSRAEQIAHLDLSTEVLIRRPKKRLELSDGYLFEYVGDEQLFVTLARWAAAEHRCCPWAAYSVEMSPFSGGHDGAIQVRVRASDEGKRFLTAAYRYLEEHRGEWIQSGDNRSTDG